jgi:hypothetical protein
MTMFVNHADSPSPFEALEAPEFDGKRSPCQRSEVRVRQSPRTPLYYATYYNHSMRTISLRLDDRTDAVLTAYCERHGLTQTGALKEAIEHLAAADRRAPAELARELGLIGAFRSAEGDLGARHSARLKERLRARHERDTLPGSSR